MKIQVRVMLEGDWLVLCWAEVWPGKCFAPEEIYWLWVRQFVSPGKTYKYLEMESEK